MKNCIIGQSGGPTAVINSSLAGAIQLALQSSNVDKILGSVYGIEGVINENLIDLGSIFSDPEKLEILKHTPSSYLNSCRRKLRSPNEEPETYEKIFNTFKQNDVAYFLYIGGNDSMDTVHKLSEYAESINSPIKIVGIPKTVDNDLAMTDHTPGFGSAAKYIATTMREIIKDSQVYSRDTLTIVEIMGRNAGWMTASAVLARESNEPAPHLIYLPEIAFDIDKFFKDIENINARYKNVIIAVSEGIKDKNGKYICEYSVAKGDCELDSFGHKRLSGTAHVLAQFINERMPKFKIRAIELSLLQRCAAHLASKVDLDEAFQLGYLGAKEAINNGKSGIMMCVERIENDYKIEIKPQKISKIANVESKIPREWINSDGNDVTEDVKKYMLPLIQGESYPVFKNGLPVYIKR